LTHRDGFSASHLNEYPTLTTEIEAKAGRDRNPRHISREVTSELSPTSSIELLAIAVGSVLGRLLRPGGLSTVASPSFLWRVIFA
jgi:hypothetical protein